ncbi:MAG TPA: hypothetical protein VI259_06995 [Gemmatimonadaceae bacterium]
MIRLSRLTLASVVGCLASQAGAQCPTSSQRRAVAALSLAYTANAIDGARIAIRDNLHEAPFGISSATSVSRDFYFGFGTALSPGLPFLVAQAGVTATLAGPVPTARKSMDLLTIFGAGYTIGQLAEPLARHTIAHPRSTGTRQFRVVVGNIVLPAAMAIVAYRACH